MPYTVSAQFIIIIIIIIIFCTFVVLIKEPLPGGFISSGVKLANLDNESL